jgi:hypothetical protein
MSEDHMMKMTMQRVSALFGLLALLGFSGAAFAQASSSPAPAMKPLSAILVELRAELDLTKASYIFKRCSGFSFATSKLIGTSGGEQLNERSVEWRKRGMDLIDSAVDTEIGIQKRRSPSSRKGKDEWTQETVGVAIEFANIYLDRMNANYLRSGNYVFDDPWLSSEYDFCIDPHKKIMDALK